MSTRRVAILGVIVVCLAGVARAQGSDVPLSNWPAPATWTPAKGMVASAQADLSNPVPFVPITPCRVADTRGNGFTGAYGPPALAASGTRSFTIAGQCGIPNLAVAVSFNFTVVGGTAAGDLRFYPGGGALPLVSTINWSAGQGALANAAVVPLGSGAITVKNDSVGTVQLIIDVNGYYSWWINDNKQLLIDAWIPNAAAIYGFNSASADGSHGVGGYAPGGGVVHGVQGAVASAAAPGSSGVHGLGGATSGTSFGVFGEANNTATDGAGVLGRDATGVNAITQGWWSAGVRGEGRNGVVGMTSTPGGYGVVGRFLDGTGTASADGLLGASTYGVFGHHHASSGVVYGVYGRVESLTDDSAGVEGIADSTTGLVYGVYGKTLSTAYAGSGYSANGVYGIAAPGPNISNGGAWSPAGVRGESKNGWGVLGMSELLGVGGFLFNGATGGVYSGAFLGFSATIGAYVAGNLSATGTKSFVEPNPVDPTKVIKYVALEGPEAGTYFRGRGRIVGGQAIIEVPENFRMVTDAEGLTVQVTPIGRAVAVSVLSADLDVIVVESNRDVEFYYMVNGVRKAFKDFEPIQENLEYRPNSPYDRMPEAYSDEQKHVLIQTGIYHEDGTVNLDTAERLGWAQEWRDRDAKVKAAAEAAAAKQTANPANAEPRQQQP